jgi:hypothetical protein
MMKLEERERIEGTDITIGRRVYYKDGATVISPRWAAEYREGTGKQVCVNLATGSKTAARRKALALHAKLEDGQPHVADARLGLEEIVDAYFAFAKAKGVAKKTEWKYRADLDKLKTFCKEQQITLAMRFGREAFYRYRESLVKQEYEPKTVYAALTVCKQVFKWGHAEGRLKEYRLINTKLAEAKAKPQPCFTIQQVEQLINATRGVEQAVIATLAYAGLRIGEVEQMKRRGGDSNSRYPCGQTGFRNRRIQPLCHLSKNMNSESAILPFPGGGCCKKRAWGWEVCRWRCCCPMRWRHRPGQMRR